MKTLSIQNFRPWVFNGANKGLVGQKGFPQRRLINGITDQNRLLRSI